MGRRFIDARWVNAYLDQTDARFARELRARQAIVEVAIVPVTPDAPLTPVVDVALVPKTDGAK